MGALSVKVDLEDAVREAAKAFESLGVDRFARAVQYSLTGVVIDGTNRFRRDQPWHSPNQATREAVRYTVDRDLLDRVVTVGDASASVFVTDLASTWLKFSFGSGPQVRLPGDVGIEAYFSSQDTIKVPVNQNLASTGLGSPGGNGKLPGRDAKRIAALAAKGYDRNTAGGTSGSGTWGVFEVRPGDTKALAGYAHKPGIWARPPRIVAAVGRERVKRKVAKGMPAPTTTFTRASGVEVTVPKVVNADVPRMLFLSTKQATMQPVATPSWDRAMQDAAATMADRMAAELADRLEHIARKR